MVIVIFAKALNPKYAIVGMWLMLLCILFKKESIANTEDPDNLVRVCPISMLITFLVIVDNTKLA